MRIPGLIQIVYAPDEGGGSAPSGGNSSSTAASTPAAAPSAPSGGEAAPSTPASSPSPASSAPEGRDDFGNLGLDFGELEELPRDVPPATATPAPTPAPVQQPPAAATPAPQQPAPAQAQPPAAQSGQQEPPAPSPAEPKTLVEQMDANREALVAHIAQEVFAISKEEAEALETDIVGNLPKMQARVFYQTMRAVHNLMASMVPEAIEKHSSVTRARDETEKAFYGKFTGLDKGKHHSDVVQFAKTFRAVNPAVTQDELWGLVASAVGAKYGLAAIAQGNGAAPPQRQPQQQPFVPARAGATVKVTPEPESAWGALGRNFDEDEG